MLNNADNTIAEEGLLKGHTIHKSDIHDDEENDYFANGTAWRRRTGTGKINGGRYNLVLFMLFCSITLNAWLLLAPYVHTPSLTPSKHTSITGLADRPKISRYEGMWRPEYDPNLADEAELDKYWHDYVSGFGVVALDSDWASQQGLQSSRAWPLDRSKSIYVFSVYHALHCVRTLRIAFKGMLAGEPVKHHWITHGLHCFEIIREELMCSADDTLHASKLNRTRTGSLRIGQGETRQCTDWEYLRDWAGRHTAGYMTDEGDEFDKAYIQDPPTTDGWNVEPLEASWDAKLSPVVEESFGIH